MNSPIMPSKGLLHRTINGEIISDRQPMLLTGGVMRGYQLDGMEWLRGKVTVILFSGAVA